MTMETTTVMGAVDVALRLGSAAVLVPSAFLLIEVVASRWGYRAAAAPPLVPTVPSPRIAVLVPAHDEAANITATVIHLRAQLSAGDRLLMDAVATRVRGLARSRLVGSSLALGRARIREREEREGESEESGADGVHAGRRV